MIRNNLNLYFQSIGTSLWFWNLERTNDILGFRDFGFSSMKSWIWGQACQFPFSIISSLSLKFLCCMLYIICNIKISLIKGPLSTAHSSGSLLMVTFALTLKLVIFRNKKWLIALLWIMIIQPNFFCFTAEIHPILKMSLN